jgi:hypothetical protein
MMSNNFKEYLEEGKQTQSEMLDWIVKGMEDTDHDHEKLKALFAAKFGKGSTKKYWDDLVTQAMGD